MIMARTCFRGQIPAVFVAIANEGHREVLQRGQQERPRPVALHLILFDDHEISVDVHSALRTLGRDVLHFARAIAVEYSAPERALNRFTLRPIKLLRGRKYAFDSAHGLTSALEKRGET